MSQTVVCRIHLVKIVSSYCSIDIMWEFRNSLTDRAQCMLKDLQKKESIQLALLIKSKIGF